MILAVLRRLRLMVVTLAAISVLSFLIIQAPPGNYLDTYVTQLRMQGDAIDDARIEALEARYRLQELARPASDRPAHRHRLLAGYTAPLAETYAPFDV